MSFYTVQNWPNGSEPWQDEAWQHDLPLGRYVHADIAIVIGTYNRAHLLLRSLFHYQHCQRPDNQTMALVVMDDGSTDYTRELCEKFANPKLPIYYFHMGDKQPGEWRDSAAFINKGISFAIHALGAAFVFPTHPEICVGETTISDSVEWLKGKVNENGFAMSRGYYLTPGQQNTFGAGPLMKLTAMMSHPGHYPSGYWTERSIAAFIAETPDFYDYGDPNHAYHHKQVEQAPIWQSWIFGGATRETWLKFGGLSESDAWGSVDVTFHSRRNAGGFKTWTPGSREAMVCHQNHDDPNQNIPTPRDMDKCMDTARNLDDRPCQPELLNPERWKI